MKDRPKKGLSIRLIELGGISSTCDFKFVQSLMWRQSIRLTKIQATREGDKLVHRWLIIKDMELFDQDILDKIGKALLKKKETIAIAESVTSGLLQFAFSNIKDASCFYQGGITTFNIGQKYKHLQVDPVHALSVNGVSQTVAEEMAKQVCILFKSDWGIAITGYASAVPSSANKIFAYYAISYKSKVKSKGKLSFKKTDPAQVQRAYVNTIVKKFLTLI